ncbi:MAG: Ribosomal RNA small subunit methyltransferase E [candidate division WS6 bacterium OLB20]|uniref:Ribosomal RNA small subunit methyltransferase E n=1 Tax=candidate division WS6 bacterium OLB20 TaxID=1617426 RepID=A0A136LYS5_9BACT|nr:MAG: Ribosomal RNA small subunit methyltransferase E [candidate division WS6 bacterium OLB20]
MHRFFVPAGQADAAGLTIDDRDTVAHIRKTLRLKPGDTVEFFDGEGNIYTAELTFVSSTSVSAEVTEHRFEQRPERPLVILAQAAPQAGKITDILRMNTEVGVDGFILFESEFGQGRLRDGKEERLERIVREAARQSERAWLPELAVRKDFAAAVSGEYTRKLFLSAREEQGAVDISSVKESLGSGDKVLVCVGPEGGFSPAEKQLALENGAEPVHLNLPVMRTQTAGIVVAAILLY